MKVTTKYSRKKRVPTTILFGVFFTLAFLVWVGHKIVSGQEDTHVFIFPTEVSGRGWSNVEASKIQTLGTDASLADFNVSNASYITIEGSPAPVPPVFEEMSEEPEPVVSSDTDEVENVSSETNESVVEVVEDVTEETQEPEVLEEAPAEADPIEVEPSPVEEVSSEPVSFFIHTKNIFSELLHKTEIVTKVFATTSGEVSGEESENADSEVRFESAQSEAEISSSDVSVCSVVGKECYTTQFSGFGTGSSLTEENIKNMRLKFSFASLAANESFSDDTLIVRYFYDGTWHVAGEFSLEGELSNALNGGYFSYDLPAFESWEEFKDLRVEFEYNRNSEGSIKLFLDSVWVDVGYEENDEVVSVEDTQNILTELRTGEGSKRPDLLVFPNDERIEFSYSDEQDNALLSVRMDEESYHGLEGSRSYVSITNNSDDPQNFTFSVRTKEGKGEITGVAEWLQSVPQTSVEPTFGNLARLCESGWFLSATGSEDQEIPEVEPLAYSCETSGETFFCDSLNEDRTNCITEGERVSVKEKIIYDEDWMPIEIITSIQKQTRSFFSRLTTFLGDENATLPYDGFDTVTQSRSDLSIASGQTLYFAVDMTFPLQEAGKFFVVAETDDEISFFGATWQSDWQYRMPITISLPSDTGSPSPTLVEILFNENDTSFWKKVRADGGDVRFFLQGTGELPVKEVTFEKENRAQYYVEIPSRLLKENESEIEVYVYFGNPAVSSVGRSEALSKGEDLLPYFTLEKPENGAVLSLRSGGDKNEVSIGGETAVSLSRYAPLDLLVPDTLSTVSLKGPAYVALSKNEKSRAEDVAYTLLPDVYATPEDIGGRRFTYLERYHLLSDTVTFGEVEELPLPVIEGASHKKQQTGLLRQHYSRELRTPQLHEFLTPLRDFGAGERAEFKLKYRMQRNVVTRLFRKLFNDRLAEVAEVRVLGAGGEETGIKAEVVYGEDGEWTIRLPKNSRQFKPGRYSLEVTVAEGSKSYVDTFDFYWGVLALNTTKSIYEPGERASIHMAALDDMGDTICDASLILTITAPDGTVSDVPVSPQDSCGPNNVTDDPDYLSQYDVFGVGTYHVELLHQNDDGTLVHKINDSFEVQAGVPFVIERQGATRIWPKADYVMRFALTAKSDFAGDFVETVPLDFVVKDTFGGETKVWGGAKHVVWNVSLKAGETQYFRYEYDAPDKSPYMYVLGPAEVRAEKGLPFTESRTWKIASDALASYTEKYVSFTPTVAATWTTIDLSGSPYNIPANAILEIAISNSEAGNPRYGGVRSGASTTMERRVDMNEAEPSGTDVTTMYVQVSATSSIQYYAENTTYIGFTILGYWTSGTYIERWDFFAPTTLIAWTNWNLNTYGVSGGNVAEIVILNTDTAPSHIGGVRSIASTTLGRTVTIHESENGGTDTATMLVNASTTNATIQYYINAADIDFRVAGYFSVMPQGLVYVERWDDLGGPTTNSWWEDRTLNGFTVPPSAIAEVLYANTANGNNMAALGVRMNGSLLSRTDNLHEAEGGGGNFGRAHVTAGSDASSTIEYFSGDTTADAFYLAGYWGAGNYPPETPTLYDVPFDNEKTGSSTPYFDFSATDPDGASDIVYEIQWDDDADLDSSPLGDETSTSTNTYFVNTVSSGDTSPFIEGEKVRFTMQSALTSGTTYYWRVRAKDVTGSDIFSDWTDVRSFTYVAGIDPKAWMQTQDAQFDMGTLLGTETYGSDSVRIATTPPVGAMVAYGEGATTTPKYRTWSGSAWSSESSAQDVGGQISWTVLKASPTRNEYVLGTQDVNGDINVQVYNGSTGLWGTPVEFSRNIPSIDRRGFDIVYQSQSGNAVIVYCDNSVTAAYNDASFATWNGTSWTATSSIDMQFNVNCNWVKLASSPISDEVIVVAQADSTNTTGDFEALVYPGTGTTWTSSQTGGANTVGEEYFERMAVQYEEESGDAVMVLGNGGTGYNGAAGSFIYYKWNGSNWGTQGIRESQDDFEWGELTADVGTDNLGLCYIDEDNQVHIARWDGSADSWNAYNLTTDRVEITGLGNGTTDYHGRGVSCQYETTAGRDGYLMIPYSDSIGARSRVWDGSALTTETSVPDIEDSWTVSSARTGDGKILSVFRDNANDLHRFSYWNGNTWSAGETLETFMSDDTEPYAEPIMIAAQRFQPSVGTILSPIMDFDLVTGQTQWGEAIWKTTEPVGTEVLVQVYYATSTGACDTLVPDTADTGLPGNSTGFSATSSPLNLSGLSTSTSLYNRLCLKASLSSNSSESPTLDEWTISFERQPFLSQEHYGWFTNLDSYTPNDFWPSGGTNIPENTPISLGYTPPKPGDVLRLRLGLKNSNVSLPVGSQSFSLQYTEASNCSLSSLDWTDVAPIGSSTALWRGYVNDIGSSDWYDTDWTNRIAITINQTYIDEDLVNFPVHVNLGSLGSSFWSKVNSNGGDIRVTTADGITEVAREVVVASTTTQTGEMFFNATAVSSTTDTVFYLYFGNSSESDYATNATYGAQNVWTGFDAVYHLGEEGNSTASGYLDSTTNAKHGTGVSMTSSSDVTGILGKAQTFDGAADYISLPSGLLDMPTASSPKTVTAWVKFSGTDDPIVTSRSSTDGDPLLSLNAGYDGADNSGGNPSLIVRDTGGGGITHFHSSVAVNSNTWRHVGYTVNTSKAMAIYVDSILRGSATHTMSAANNGMNIPAIGAERRWIADNYGAPGQRYALGDIDEVRISSSVRSVAWIKAEYLNATSTTSFYSTGGSEKLGDGNSLPSYVLTTSDVAETYEEENYSATNTRAIAVGEEGEWDWVIENNSATANTNYCFRMVQSDGTLLGTYNDYPQLITNSSPNRAENVGPFDNNATSSIPQLEFVAEDPEGNDLNYQVQVSTDITFTTTSLNRNSNDNASEFTNMVTVGDRKPFNSGQQIRFVSSTGLSSDTYWWRVRATDPLGSNGWGEWSEPTSFTIDPSVTITTWHQTTFDQFERADSEQTEATSSNSIVLSPPNTTGTSTSQTIDFDWKISGNAWGSFANTGSGNVLYHIEYNNGNAWVFIPDSVLSGNAVGFGTSTSVSLLGLDPTIYNEIRVAAVFNGTNPTLNEWTISWGLAVEQPTLLSPFDNEKVSTLTPSFRFYSTDPQGDKLQYEIQWSSTPDFTASTTRTSGTDSLFVNTASSTDPSPFIHNNIIRFTVQAGDALVDGNTYWWRVRASDSLGVTWSVRSLPRSFTVNTSVTVSTWFQTTDDQFNTDTLSNTETTVSDTVRITTTLREAFLAYAESTGQYPRYRIWNGSTWGGEESAQNVGEQMRWVRSAAAPTRDEYMIATMGASGAVKAQIYDGSVGSFDDLTTIVTSSANVQYRGYDVAYESNSGDGMVASCSGADAVIGTWNGTVWATSTVPLTFIQNCEWLKLAGNPDPGSDEIILVARANIAETNTDYEAVVWNGSSWEVSNLRFGIMSEAGNEGMAVEYEEDGSEALVVVSDAGNGSFQSARWSGSWSATSSVAIANDFESGVLKRDPDSNRLALCYVDQDADVGYVEWSGSSWGAYAELDTLSAQRASDVIACEYETTSGRAGNIMFNYGDTTALTEQYRYFDRASSTLSVEGTISTIGESTVAFSTRTGDGKILSVFFDDDNTRYDFSYWNGLTWSTRELIEDNSIADATVNTAPLSIVARRYPAVTSGTVVGSGISFADGIGPRWGSMSWSDTMSGSADDIKYQIEYYDMNTDSWALIPPGDLPGNDVGTSTGSIDLSVLDYTTYSSIRPVANLTCALGFCPVLNDWTVSWAEGITVSGTAKAYDQVTNSTSSASVAIAVDGVIQSSKTGTIVGGTWTINNVTIFPGQVFTVFLNGADEADEAIAVSGYDGVGDITGVQLIARHLVIGSPDATTTRNVDIGLYDNSVSGDEDIFFDVTGTSLSVCAISGCSDAELYVTASSTYRPSGTLTTHDVEINGMFTADSNALNVSGSWDNNGRFVSGNSTLTFTATAGTESIDSTGAATSSLYNVTFGSGSGTATWNLITDIDVNGNTTLDYGTLSQGSKTLLLSGDFTIGTNGIFAKGTGTTTFDGALLKTWTDNTIVKQDMGTVVIDGSTKVIQLGSGVKVTNMLIGLDDSLDVTAGNRAIEVKGNWTNSGIFTAYAGTVTFTATSAGKVITAGASSFGSVTFNGVGGEWSFQDVNVGFDNDFVITNGTVNMPTGITTIKGLFTNNATFSHPIGTMKFTSTATGKTITLGGISVYNMSFDGFGGGWTMVNANATTTNDFTITLGTVTLPSNTLEIGGSFNNVGGTFNHAGGTVFFNGVVLGETIQVRTSSFNNTRFAGITAGAPWYADAWSERSVVTVQETKVDANLTDFPVYVNLADLGNAFWSAVQSDGEDIRVTTSNGTTELPYELVAIDTGAKTGELYFKASSVSSSTNSTFYIYYGNSAASGYASTTTYGTQNVWTNGYDTVLHMRENPAGTAPQMKDSTSYNHNGTTGNSPPSNKSVVGKFGNALDFSGGNYYVDFTNSDFTSYTYSMWLKPNSYASGVAAGGDGTYFVDRQTSSNALASLKAVGSNYAHQYRDNGGSVIGAISGGAIKTNGSWQFVAWGRSSGVNFFTQTDDVTYTGTPSVGALTPADPRLGIHQGLATGAYDGVIDEVRIANTARSAAWLKAEYLNGATTTDFYATSTEERLSQSGWRYVDTNATQIGNMNIVSGEVLMPSGNFTIGGSFANTGSFRHNNGTFIFNSSDAVETVAPGSSLFYNVQFNHTTGGWIVSGNATARNNWTLTNAASFNAGSGVIEVQGQFTNALDGANTNWNTSTLYLNSSTTYSINTKTAIEDTYSTLQVGANTDIRMWNSSAGTTTVNSTGSLYSQDHDALLGDLYIWGDYNRTSGTEYWSYANDFDGTPGANRQVDVRLAPNATTTFSGGTLELVGLATASTTVANQGAGTYAITISGGTVKAQYYQFRNLDTNGLNLTGAPTVDAVSNFSNGDFQLAVSGGTMMKVASTTINANPAMQIWNVRFATSTGVSSGYNVTEVGSSTSNWWFRSASGNYSGEAYDNDPAGSPGYIKWDDSGVVITISGHVYADKKTTTRGAACNGSTPVVSIKVNGAGSYTTSCSATDGSYTIPNVSFSGDVVLTTYLLSAGGTKGATVSRTPSVTISNMDVYENHVITRHEDTLALTIDDMATFDSDNDANIPFNAINGTPDSLSVSAGNSLFIWAGKTFTPGGNITVNGVGTSTAYDGTLYIDSAGILTGEGTQTHTIGGSWVLDSGASYVSASTTVMFTATSTGKIVQSGSAPFWDITMNGSGGGWNMSGNTTVKNDMTLSSGTVIGTSSIFVQGGDITGNGTFAMTGGTVALSGTGTFGGGTNWSFAGLSFGDGVTTAQTTKVGTNTISASGVLTVVSLHTLNAGGQTWNLTGGGTPLVVGGTFNSASSTVRYSGIAGTTVKSTNYYNLTLAPSGAGSPTYVLQSGTFAIGQDLTVGDGTYAVTVNANTQDPVVNVSRNVSVSASSTYISSNTGTLSVGGSWSNSGIFSHGNGTVIFNSTDTGETIRSGGSPFYVVTFNSATGGWTTIGNASSTNNFNLTNASSFNASSSVIEVRGIFTNAVGGSATTWNNATLYINSGTTQSINASTTGADIYGTLRAGANTQVRMWNSTSSAYTIDSTGSLYSQDHDGVNGDLYIWGNYTRSSGADHWSYATDFDGSDISGSPRQAHVYLADNATTTITGGSLYITGTSSDITTIDHQGSSGYYSVTINGGNINAQYYSFRNLNRSGLRLLGSSAVTNLSDGDYEMAVNGGSMITVAGSVINANPVKTFYRNRFATSTGVTAGYNVEETSVSVSSWRFTAHTGEIAGEFFDLDLGGSGGNPGNIVWDDSDDKIVVRGFVYEDEAGTVSQVCDDGATEPIRLMTGSTASSSTSCSSSDGSFTISDIGYIDGDTLTLYLDNAIGGRKAVNVTIDPFTDISMNLYENRVVVRHEDTTPIEIADMIQYDSDQDTDILFDAEIGTPNTLIVAAGTKFVIWDNKTFVPAGNVTLTGGGISDHSGTLAIRDGATFSAAGTQTHTIGGSWFASSTASFVRGGSTVIFSAATGGKTIQTSGSAFNNLTFNGSGGAWTIVDTNATTTNNMTITNGSVALPSGIFTVGGAFSNAGSFTHNSGTVLFTSASSTTVTAGASPFYTMTFNGVGGSWTFSGANATSSHNMTITNGSVTLPSGVFTVGGSFTNAGSFTHNSGTVLLTSTVASTTITAGGSSFYSITMNGVGGEWTFQDINATTSNNFTITNGLVNMPTGITTIGGSFTNNGTFSHPIGTMLMTASSTGKTVGMGTSKVFNITFNNSLGGWTVQGNATSTNSWNLASANAFAVSSGSTVEVQGTFTNAVGGASTTWDGTTLYLNSATAYSANAKTTGGDSYDTLFLGTNTDVRMWNSRATTTTAINSSSLYSQDYNTVDGNLYIWGDYVRSTGADYWSYAKDFDGTDISGTPRQAKVYIANNATTTFSGGTLEIIGNSSLPTLINNQGSGTYAFMISGGTFNANYYQIRNTNTNGLNFVGSPAITSLDNGDFELAVNGGSMITVEGTVITQNYSKIISGVAFATSSGITSGYNVKVASASANSWTFNTHSGNYDGEAYDSDGGDDCGSVRWSDSVCLLVNQTHFRWRNDDGGEGVPANEWFNTDWTKRKKIRLIDTSGTSLTNYQARVLVTYDSDMQANFGDLRFTDSSGTTTIPYWIESYTTGTSTVWVKVPSISANGTADIYMYYDNVGTVTTSGSGTSTFVFFDDFEHNDITTYAGNRSYFNIGTTFGYQGTYGLDAAGNEDGLTTGGGMYRTSGVTIPQNSTIRWFQYVNASYDDDTCTLFGVGSLTTNYGICFDQYSSPEQLLISKNVTTNGGSGTILASTTVSWTTGWKEVKVDWRSNNSMYVSVYNSSGSLIATTSVIDSSYTTGGMGFSYWGQHGGWDLYTARAYSASAPSYTFGLEQQSGGASWKVGEDTILTGQDREENVRLRFSIQNSGPQVDNQNFRLQYANKSGYANCLAVPPSSFTPAPTETGGCGNSPVCIASSSQFMNKAATAQLLSSTGNVRDVAGQILQDPSNETDDIDVPQGSVVDVEYNFQMTLYATSSEYCFRTTDGEDALENYAQNAELKIRHAPNILSFTLNGDRVISLTENATTTVSATGTVQDLNGCSNISYATSTFYRSMVSGGSQCVDDPNNCYQMASSSCLFSGCINGTVREFSCSTNFQYFADPTAPGSLYDGESWLPFITISDMEGNTDTSTGFGVNVGILHALGVFGDINYSPYGPLDVGSDTGTFNASSTLQNTGNENIDIQVAGTDLVSSGGSISADNQTFATSSFTYVYGGCAICSLLSGTSTDYEVDLPKPTSTSTPITDVLFWGLNVPPDSPGLQYFGTNVFYATSD